MFFKTDDLTQGLKEINDVVGQFQGMIDTLKSGMDKLFNRKEANELEISNLKLENRTISSEIGRAETLLENLIKLTQ